jgi:nitric oxide reductase activation protein
MNEDFGIPDLAVMFLVDGSGSMEGLRRESAMVSSVILHEVLKKQGMAHAIVEQRAEFDNPVVRINILVGFNARNEEKYNLMALAADGNSREGLSLYWAERFLTKNTSCSQRLIIVLADGAPMHNYDDYTPPVSSKDTANAAVKIIRRGTDIIAVALDDGGNVKNNEYACYDALKEIYPSVISCTDLKRLTGQLLSIISKNLQ